jgi:hypothetical protein
MGAPQNGHLSYGGRVLIPSLKSAAQSGQALQCLLEFLMAAMFVAPINCTILPLPEYQHHQTPSMRRPVDVKAHFRFLLSMSLFLFSQAASVAILPSALFCERYSLGARWVFSFQ